VVPPSNGSPMNFHLKAIFVCLFVCLFKRETQCTIDNYKETRTARQRECAYCGPTHIPECIGFGDGSSPMRSRGEPPVGGLWDNITQKL